MTIFQEDAKDAGIKINLVFETPATLWKNVRTKQYQLASMAWGALVIPNPETSYGGHLADLVDNNNITSFKNDRVDELCKALLKADADTDVRCVILTGAGRTFVAGGDMSEFDAPPVGLMGRSKRYAMLVDDGKVTLFQAEVQPGVCDMSGGEALLDNM